MSINEPFVFDDFFAMQDGETTLHLTVRYLTVAIALEIIDEMKRVMDQEEFVKAINTRNRVQVAYTSQKINFSMEVFSVNLTKFTVSCGFGYIFWRILNGKLENLLSVNKSVVFCQLYSRFLAHFMQLVFFYTPENIRKTLEFFDRE